MPKVSVILPVYNVEKYLRQCLDSVVNQTLRDIEIICVDDCSTDNSYEILNEYAAKDDRFVILKQETNQGQGVARNRALDIAKGEYIMFLDPDDWYELDACESAYNQITKNNNDIAFFNLTFFYEQNNTYKVDTQRLNRFAKDINNPQIKFYELDYPFFGNGESVYKIYKRELLNKNNIRFPNYRFCEDVVFYANVIAHAQSASILNKSLYNYRIRSNSAISKCLYKDLLKSQQEAFEIVCNSKYSDVFIPKYVIAYIQSLIYWFYKYTKKNKSIEKDFYNNMRTIFIDLDKRYMNEYVRQYVPKKTLKIFNKIVNQNYAKFCKIQTLRKIFSIVNENGYKILTILGIRIKHRIGISPFSYKFLSFLMSWIFPTKGDRKRFRNLCNDIDERKDILKAHKNYQKIIKRIKNKKGKIKVLFLVSENSKWKAQSLYDLMAQSDKFEPVIALTLLNDIHNGAKSTRNHLEEDYIYFKNRNMNVLYTYKKHSYKNLKTFEPDIIFYQQPWSINKVQLPQNTSKYAIPYYIPYYVNTYGVYSIDYDKPFHKYMFRHYVLNKEWESEYKKLTSGNNIYGLGHTMLDEIYLNKNNKVKNNYVIYAPHYSFLHPKNKNLVNYGTFLKNGYQILEYAKAHPEINWVFKPHPRLKDALLDIGKSHEQIEEYWSEWTKIGIVCEDSSYMDLFLDSKTLITDCSSFLTEYFCTKKPLIHLISSDCKIQPNDIAKKNFNTFYQVHNLDEMYETFDKVLIQNIDDKKEERLKVLEETGLLNNYAAQNILQDLENTLGLQKTS